MAHVTHALHVALGYAGRVTLTTLAQLLLVLGPPLVLAALMQAVSQVSERWTARLVGPRARWIVVGWIATAFHELSHAAFALLFGHRVTRMKWFDFRAADGTHGKVEHAYDPTSPFQRVGRFFIGMGPVILATIVLVVAARLLVGVHALPSHPEPSATLPTLGATVRPLVAQLGDALSGAGRLAAALHPARWATWAFLYVAYVGGSAMRLSASDLRSAGAGMCTLGGLLLVVNALTLWAGALASDLALGAARSLALCNAALLAAIALQTIVGVVALALTHGLDALRGRATALAGG